MKHIIHLIIAFICVLIAEHAIENEKYTRAYMVSMVAILEMMEYCHEKPRE
jgi:hypothetical protein